ncbi:hypothetical protein SSRG_02475 [Streptomyces griseoflavus Tu4000]|uniref:Uncharacterized protein n=1 Tax=Streptomyces griseoflavus Tu4000 TaxID=467200 RepID=D9XVE3_9ACTN|nr:hypothetical protein SSRG_02475 [Streptomyces griseoflavus Tu4000]
MPLPEAVGYTAVASGSGTTGDQRYNLRPRVRVQRLGEAFRY